jgi:hypothetical protein
MLRNLSVKPRWKEELVISCDAGKFSIDLTMGTLKVYLPDESSFDRVAPAWAQGHWSEVHDAVKQWCESNYVPLVVESNGRLYTV